MITDQELIAKIRELKQIQPRKDWVLLTKSQLFSQEETYRGRVSVSWLDALTLRWHPRVVAPLLLIMVAFGLTFTLAQSSVPGDFLYPVKKVSETAQVNLVSGEEKPKVHLELANKRLEDLDRIAKENRVENLAPAIKEFQENVVMAAKELSVLEANTSSDPVLIKAIAKESQKLRENKEKLEALGIVLGETDELDSALAKLVEREIADLEGRTLNEEQLLILERAKDKYLSGDYSAALEEILLINTANH